MQERPNYQYYDNNSNKDSNQSMQSQNKGKKQNYKYYKGGSNKNILNNIDEKMNINEHSQNYQYYRNRGNRKNYQDINPNFKKKNKKKRESNNNYQYQGNNTSEINQSKKEEYLEKQNNIIIGGGGGNNNHQNIYTNQYKKNQNQNFNNNNLINNNINSNLNNTIESINTNNTNSTNSSNISNINLTPQGKNRITTPLGYNINNSNSPLNKMITHPQQTTNQNPSIYINPKLVIMRNMRNTSISENEQESLKDEKSSENLSEETLYIGRNLQQSQNDVNNNIDINKNQNELIKQEMTINNKLFQQQGSYFPMHYNLNNSINNNQNRQNIHNYNQNIANQLNNSIQNMNNLSLNNYQRQMYDNQNNKIFNKDIQQNYSFSNNDEIKNHQQINKFQNQSPNDPNILSNSSINLGNMINLNYNGPNNKFIKNQNNNMNNNINLSSQGTKNTIPNFTKNENLNLMPNRSQQIPSLINMNFITLNNRNFYIPQNMRNSHMNNNFINNNHMNNNINNKDNYNNGHNNNINNNKKYQKQYNYNNSYQSFNNNQNYNNKNNLNNDINNKSISFNNASKNYNQRTRKESTGFPDSNKSNNHHSKYYLLCLNLKLGNNKKEIINIKSIEDCSVILKELKENQNLNEKTLKLIQNKIYETIEITKKIFNFGLDKYTYISLAEINNKLTYNKGGTIDKKIHKNNSSKQINKYFENEIILSKNDIKKIESLNLTF